jgi:predicted DNA-binding WGR domain protein
MRNKHVKNDNTGTELRQIDAGRNRFRRYHMSECRSLFGEPGLVVAWGRIGRAPRVRVETFPSPAGRKARWTELLTRRDQHGYTVVTERVESRAAIVAPDRSAARVTARA